MKPSDLPHLDQLSVSVYTSVHWRPTRASTEAMQTALRPLVRADALDDATAAVEELCQRFTSDLDALKAGGTESRDAIKAGLRERALRLEEAQRALERLHDLYWELPDRARGLLKNAGEEILEPMPPITLIADWIAQRIPTTQKALAVLAMQGAKEGTATQALAVALPRTWKALKAQCGAKGSLEEFAAIVCAYLQANGQSPGKEPRQLLQVAKDRSRKKKVEQSGA